MLESSAAFKSSTSFSFIKLTATDSVVPNSISVRVAVTGVDPVGKTVSPKTSELMKLDLPAFILPITPIRSTSASNILLMLDATSLVMRLLFRFLSSISEII